MQVKKYGLKAINDEAETCSICGKVHLKRVMWIVELDQDGGEMGDPFNCGTTCGAKLLGYSYSAINTKIKNFEAEVEKRRTWLMYQHPAYKKSSVLIKELNADKLFGKARKADPRYAEMTQLRNAARDWAAVQEIVIELTK